MHPAVFTMREVGVAGRETIPRYVQAQGPMHDRGFFLTPTYFVNVRDRNVSIYIANLQISEASFKVPSALGEWEFNRTANYDDAGQHIDAGMCAHTYIATNASVNFSTRRTDVGAGAQ